MSTDIGGRPVLRPAGNVARSNLKKATKPPPSPVKSKALPPSSTKISPPNSLPSTPKTVASSPATRNPSVKPSSPSKLPTSSSLSPKKPPTPSPLSLDHTHQELLSEAPLLDGSKSAVTDNFPSFPILDLSSDGSSLSSMVDSSSATAAATDDDDDDDGVTGPSTPPMGSDSALNGSGPSQNGSSLLSSNAIRGSRPSLSRSKSLSKPSQSGSRPSPDLPHAPKPMNPHISLNKSTSEVFHRGASSHVKTKSTSKKNLSKLGSLSFDESSLATMVAAKKAAANEINAQRKQKVSEYGRKQGKASRIAPDVSTHLSSPSVELRRCKFITAQSDPVYVAYHDNEWGVPVHDDRLLFELLVLSGFQGELSWTTILHKRDAYRAVFAEFDPAAVASFDEKHIQSLEADKSLGLPGGKIRGMVENAHRILEVLHEFGSLGEYIWGFVNKQPMMNHYRYPKQVPVKTSKAEFISKDLVKRGFRFVGPTIIYSFMQASGMTNDHLVQCFRHQECMKVPCASSVGLIEEKLEKPTRHEDGEIRLRKFDFSLGDDSEHEVHLVDGVQLCGQDEWSQKLEGCTHMRESEEQENNESQAM